MYAPLSRGLAVRTYAELIDSKSVERWGLGHGTPCDRGWGQSPGVDEPDQRRSAPALRDGVQALLRHLAAYRQRKAHAMTVVCDGW